MGIDPGACLLWALLLLVLPLKWLMAAVLAAAFHELCHWAALIFLGYRPGRLSLRLTGAFLDIPEPGYAAEALCAMAGPVGSLSLTLLAGAWPELAICGLFQGLFNLIPVYPLDGGRFLRCITLLVLKPDRARCLCRGVKWAVLLCAGALLWRLGDPKWCLTACFWLGLRYLAGKIPCKPAELRVQ